MRHNIALVLLAAMLSAASPSGFAQLRNLSDYTQDCIHIAQTSFILRENNVAEFQWASEWTHTTAYAYPDKQAIFVWKFKDGSKAYSHQGDFLIGDLGKATGYLITGQTANLEDVHGKKIQPMTVDNYPVEFELWIGEIDASTGYAPEILLDRICYEPPDIRMNEPNHFSRCK